MWAPAHAEHCRHLLAISLLIETIDGHHDSGHGSRSLYTTLQTSLACLSVATLLCALAPFLKKEDWWIRGFDFPRLQFLVLGASLAVLNGLILDFNNAWHLAATVNSLLSTAIQAYWIFPYTPMHSKEVEDDKGANGHDTLALMTANVFQPNKNKSALLKIVQEAQPDVLVAMETDQAWLNALDALETEEGYTHTIKYPLDNLYGIAVYSKFPLENTKVQFLVEHNVPSIHVLIRLPSGLAVRAHFLHPCPPSPTENPRSTQRDAELVMVGKSVRNSTLPTIVAGDLNDVAWSSTTRLFRRASGLLDLRIGRGMFNTFHAKKWYIRWPLDHLFCSSHFSVSDVKCLPCFGSDHFSILVKLVCSQTRSSGDSLINSEPEHEERMEAKLDSESVSENDVHNPEDPIK